MNKKKITILILSLAVITVVSGCVKKQTEQPVVQDDNRQEVNKQDIAAEKTGNKEEATAATDEIDISDWQTYRNEEYGYKIKYPLNLEAFDCDSQPDCDALAVSFVPVEAVERWRKYGGGGDVTIFTRENPEKLSMKEFYNGKSGINLYQDAWDGYESIIIDGQSAVKFNSVTGMIASDVVVIPWQNKFIQLSDYGRKDTFEKMLESFEFLDKEVALDVSIWQIYENKKYGYKVKYPSDWELIKISDDVFIGFTPPDMERVKGYYNRDIDILVRKNPEKLSIEKFYNGKSGINFYEDAWDGYESIIIDGQSAVKFKGVIGMLTRDIVVIPLTDNFFIELAVDEHKDTFEKMLKSFEFLKQ